MRIDGFDWDAGNIKKAQIHGLAISEIEMFLANNPFVYPELKNSEDEDRFLAFDRFGEKILFVCFTIRAISGNLRIRVISARYAHKKEWEKFYGEI